VQLTPAYERDGVRLYAGDCLAVLPTLEAGSVDAIVTDPPYGIRVGDRSDGGVASVKSGSKSYGRTEWDRAPAPPEFFELALSYQVPTVIWGGNYFALPPSPSWLVWDKGQRNFSFADAELAWTNLGKAVRIFDCPRGRLVAEGHKWHPTQKPLSLMIWCMSFLPKECTVLDPFAGSASTLVACLKTGRRGIGIEIDERYIAPAIRRLEGASTPLFDQLTQESHSCSSST
jgi:DNA modification methylase